VAQQANNTYCLNILLDLLAKMMCQRGKIDYAEAILMQSLHDETLPSRLSSSNWLSFSEFLINYRTNRDNEICLGLRKSLDAVISDESSGFRAFIRTICNIKLHRSLMWKIRGNIDLSFAVLNSVFDLYSEFQIHDEGFGYLLMLQDKTVELWSFLI
jgi:hypothetical protein